MVQSATMGTPGGKRVIALDSIRDTGLAVFRRIEHGFDVPFGADNPWRHLGALGFYFFWVLTASGIYLYIFLDTSAAGVYESVARLSREQWYAGGVLRSMHRYAADAFVVVTLLHLAREFLLGRYAGFRWYSWVTGVPLLWLAYATGISGFWLAWDRLGQFSAIASAEWLDWLPIFAGAVIRNFLTPQAISDRFFTLLVFIHIGVPLLLLFGLWFHIQRVSRADAFPPRKLAAGVLFMLVALSLVHPVHSDAPADLALAPQQVAPDWFLLFWHPLMYASSPGAAWALAVGLTVLLFVLPLLPHAAPQPIARVDPDNCNGCRRCFDDCPYAAIVMAPHASGNPQRQMAQVIPDLCAACGICAGACPSSTPFRSGEELVSGIDMPQLSVGALRARLEQGLFALSGTPKIVVFGCNHGADERDFGGADTVALSLLCAAQLPPSFVEYALRSGADGVLVTACRPGGCAFRLGERWLEERLQGRREPHLRGTVAPERLRLVWADGLDQARLKQALEDFRRELATLDGTAGPQRRHPTGKTSHG